MLDQRIIEQIIEGNNIVSVIEQYLPLKKTGASYKACCPFHDEKTPSFVVSDKKQIFKCFGCGKGGNVIHFVQEIESITFFEALEKLALKAGIKLQKHRKDPAFAKKRSRQDLLLKTYELAKDHYCDNMRRFGDSLIQQLEERGISKETIEKFELGYALNSNSALYNHLTKCEINSGLLANSGLFIKTQKGIVDLFRERLIFPIHSAQGNVMAFGARIVSPGQQGGKYINSPTTDLYTKGRELYGFHLTRHEIRKKEQAIVTEGYTDFLRLYENGFLNSVATLGTAFTEEQVKLLTRYSKNIYILYDGDLAGKKAAVKAAENIIVAGASPKIVSLPDGEDADSFLKNQTKEDLAGLIDTALPLTDYLFQNNDLFSSIKEKLEILLESANQISDLLNRELFLKEIAQTFNLSMPSLTQRMRRRRKTDAGEQKEKKNNLLSHHFMEEKYLLLFLLNGLIDNVKLLEEIDSAFFFNKNYKKVFEILATFDYIVDDKRLATILSDLEDKDAEQVKIITELSMTEVPPIPFEIVVNDLKIRKFQNELRLLDQQISSDHVNDSLLEQKKELVEKIRNSSRKVIHKNRL